MITSALRAMIVAFTAIVFMLILMVVVPLAAVYAIIKVAGKIADKGFAKYDVQ